MRTAHALILFLFSSFIPIFSTSAEAPDIIISEVQIGGATADDEFVRLRNDGEENIDLAGFRLTKKYASGGVCKESLLVSDRHFQGTIASGATFLIAHPEYKESYRADLDYSSASYYLTNNTIVTLYDDKGAPVSEKTIGTACGTDPPSDRSDTSIDTSTDASIRLNELLPNPKGADAEGEWIELYNFGEETILLDGWSITDAAGGVYPLEAGSALGSGAFLVVKTGSKFSMNNTSSETVTLLDATKTAIGKVSYETAKEGQSFNYSPSGWRWSKKVTPGKANTLNNPPERTKTEIPKTAYRDVYADFFAKGSDKDGDAIKYVWDFGDKHKSYLRETRHKYAETGSFHGTLTISDGTETDVKEFTIRVEKFPDRKIRVIALSANPKGADTGVEWLLLKNKDKKKVDLLGWSIATGTKKKSIANHPINESFILKPGEERRLMNPVALFTLPNERGYIELRKPDGKAVQTVKYRKDGGVDDGERYSKKEGGGWEWAHQKKQGMADNERTTETNGLEKNPASTIPDETDQVETVGEAAISGMSVIEERRKEKRLAEIIRQESHIDTPIKLLAAPPSILGATIEFDQAIPSDTVPRESFFEKINEVLNDLVHEL